MRTLTFNRILGAGAMGTVYHAELKTPRGFVRPCAVKVMKGAGPDREQFMARMRDEARLLGMLQDEQVIGVSELVIVGDRDAVIMDYVEGIDLSDLVEGKGVPPRALCELGAEIAGTLYRAHKARHPSTGKPLNVIHRDIKPANVMITSRGGVRLLDFGVARAAFSDRESHTQGLVLGTLNYFPPEVLAGGEPTPAVDVYGLGLTLWECATGKQWGTPQAQQQRFERRVDQRVEELPGDFKALVSVLRSILQWDPKLRPDGGVVERALLHAAGQSPGDGLRVWARDVIPDALAARDRVSKTKTDELVGKTLEVQSVEDGDSDSVLQSIPAMPAVRLTPAPASERADTKPSTPPGAAPRNTPQRSNPPGATPRPAPARPTPARSEAPARSDGRPWMAIAVAGVVVGAMLAAVVIVIVMLALAVALS